MSNFHPLEVVGRGSETQLQVGENVIKLPTRDIIPMLCYADLYPLSELVFLKRPTQMLAM